MSTIITGVVDEVTAARTDVGPDAAVVAADL